MPQYQGIWTLQQQAQALTSGQWVTDPSFKNTTLLLQGDNTSGSSQNNVFVDSSTNNFLITRNGNTTQGSFTPFSQAPGWWGVYFLSGSSNIDFPTTTNLNLPGNFTIDFWFNLSTISATSYIFSGTGSTIQTVSSNLVCYDGVSNQPILTAPQPNTWYYIALVRSGTTVTPYVNGIAGTPFTNSSTTAFTHSAGRIGASVSGGGSPISGYVSNYRVSNVARSISVPSVPYTSDANTLALVCATNRFNDLGVNNLTLTTGTGTTVQPFSPFAPQYQYTPTVIGGSGYFDGTGDYLYAGNNAAFTMGTGDFTYECWVYHTSITGQQTYFARTNGNFNGVYFYKDSSGFPGVYYTAQVATSSVALTANQWYHLVASRLSGTLRIFVNGVQTASVANTTNLTESVCYVGGDSNATNPMIGYMSGCRILKGTGYSSITVPTAPPTAITNTSLLLNFTNAGIFDATMKNNLETVGNAQVSTAVVKYGSGSLYFPGSGSYTIMRDTPNLTFGSGDFTLEFWLFNTVSGSDIVLFDGRPTTTNGLYITLSYIGASGVIAFYTNSAYQITGTQVLPLNTWTHVALCKANNQTRLFLNGVQTGSTYADTNTYVLGSNRPTIAGNGYTLGGAVLTGYIDDFRITKGLARYTQNFTPPLVALPRQ